ncbi:hypothetical protein E2C01_030263 [Portunus trituberculatus]|uniref:Uncharacterized protein n=1 Tax=Portunus trituberculatus TaxID=210409 RepID=A0A5B7EUE3_PORTR|nr:hypothetical protein [Portunus trituberculatus]
MTTAGNNEKSSKLEAAATGKLNLIQDLGQEIVALRQRERERERERERI